MSSSKCGGKSLPESCRKVKNENVKIKSEKAEPAPEDARKNLIVAAVGDEQETTQLRRKRLQKEYEKTRRSKLKLAREESGRCGSKCKHDSHMQKQ